MYLTPPHLNPEKAFHLFVKTDEILSIVEWRALFFISMVPASCAGEHYSIADELTCKQQLLSEEG